LSLTAFTRVQSHPAASRPQIFFSPQFDVSVLLRTSCPFLFWTPLFERFSPLWHGELFFEAFDSSRGGNKLSFCSPFHWWGLSEAFVILKCSIPCAFLLSLLFPNPSCCVTFSWSVFFSARHMPSTDFLFPSVRFLSSVFERAFICPHLSLFPLSLCCFSSFFGLL